MLCFGLYVFAFSTILLRGHSYISSKIYSYVGMSLKRTILATLFWKQGMKTKRFVNYFEDEKMDIGKITDFIEEAERLKTVTRTAKTSEGKTESTAEHSWRLALLACVVADEYSNLNMERVLTMCLIHDIGEIYEGDIPAIRQVDKVQKYEIELRAAKKIFSLLPEEKRNCLMEIWKEYNDCKTPEARLVKALDKAETILQHNQGKNPDDFDYGFNLYYGQEFFNDPNLKELRTYLDERTRDKILKENPEFKQADLVPVMDINI